MSIIQEALQKAQVDAKSPVSKVGPEKNASGSGTELKPAEQKIIKKKIAFPVKTIAAGLALIALLSFAIFSAKQFLHLNKKSQRVSPEAIQEVTYRPLVKPEPDFPDTVGAPSQSDLVTTLKDIAGRPSLILNGIMYLEDRPKAIINNSIVETGDSVGGATVTKINPKNVVLAYNDTEITLNLK